MNSSVINIDPDILGGTPVFQGTRVPIESLFDHLEGGVSLDEFWMISRLSKRSKQLRSWLLVNGRQRRETLKTRAFSASSRSDVMIVAVGFNPRYRYSENRVASNVG